MTNKTRKFIGSASLVAALAIVGALALFGVLALPNADSASAQGDYPPPTNVRAEAGNATITVRWGPSSDPTAVRAYQTRHKKTSESDWGAAADATAGIGTRSDTIAGLDNGDAYMVQVRADYGDADDDHSDWMAASGTFTPIAEPTIGPTNVKAEAGTFGNTLTVTWTASTETTITHYFVRYRTSAIEADAAATPPIVAEAAGDWMPDGSDSDATDGMRATGTMAEVAGLDAGTSYDVQVTSANSAGALAFPTFADADAADTDATVQTSASTSTEADDEFSDSSTSSSAGVELKLTIGNLPMSMVAGSSIELYLEDDFLVPNSIDKGDVYFIVTNPTTAATNAGGRVRPTDAVEIDDDDHYGGDDDYAIQVFIPDMDTSDRDAAAGFQGPQKGQTLTLVITKAAGIKNPSEDGTHSVGYAVLGANADANDGPDTNLDTVRTKAKVSLSDEDNSRGYELVVTGSGFNNDTSAAVYVMQDARFATAKWWETLDCAGMKTAMKSESNEYCFHYDVTESSKTYMVSSTRGHADALALSESDRMKRSNEVFEAHLCRTMVQQGSRVASGTVGKDDKVTIPVEVTVPTFMPGNSNYVCIVDGEGRLSTDADQFELEPSIKVSPSTATVGDTVTVFAQDFPSGSFPGTVMLASRTISHAGGGTIGTDGSATATFVVPGWAEGTLRVDAGGENTKLTVIGSKLSVSKAEALPNELLTITGDGFSTGTGNHVPAENVTIDGVPLRVHDDSVNRDDQIDVSNSGQFVATVVLWPAEGSGTNPSLTSGVHTIKVVDNNGFSGTVKITIPTPSIGVSPEIAGPRDIITISGENWPVDNVEGAAPPTVTIEVDDGRPRSYSALPDSAGRWFVEHRIASQVAIPSTNRVTATIGSEVVKIATFEVPSAIIEVAPGEGQPGDTVTLSVDKMPVYAAVDSVQIAGREALPAGNFSTDRTGSVTVEGVVIPGLDPGTYSILMDIDGTVAIGSLEVLSEGPIGSETPVGDALSALGDNLDAVFYFDNISKDWKFHDPRPEFAELNTLANLVNGEAYWVLVSEDVTDVVLNNKSHSLTCKGGDCWNLVIW